MDNEEQKQRQEKAEAIEKMIKEMGEEKQYKKALLLFKYDFTEGNENDFLSWGDIQFGWFRFHKKIRMDLLLRLVMKDWPNFRPGKSEGATGCEGFIGIKWSPRL